jgi:hypothetical protein
LTLKKPGRTEPIPGSGTVFALRVIGIVLLIRWVHSMSDFGLTALLQAMAGSAWACINVAFIALLIVLPGARARAERPAHPLPQWLRQALRGLGALSFVFAAWLVGYYLYRSGYPAGLRAVRDANGWPLVAPVLFAATVWLCRPRPLWPTNPVARRFAVGRFTVTLDPVQQTATVWAENRKVGQYAVQELALCGSRSLWPARASLPKPAKLAAAPSAATTGGATDAEPAPRPVYGWNVPPSFDAERARSVALLWSSPAAAGHNRHVVFRAMLWSAADRFSARALDAALRRA